MTIELVINVQSDLPFKFCSSKRAASRGDLFAYAAWRCDHVMHIISRTRPSCFSACRLGMGLGMRLAISSKLVSRVTLPTPTRYRLKSCTEFLLISSCLVGVVMSHVILTC